MRATLQVCLSHDDTEALRLFIEELRNSARTALDEAQHTFNKARARAATAGTAEALRAERDALKALEAATSLHARITNSSVARELLLAGLGAVDAATVLARIAVSPIARGRPRKTP